MNKWFLACVILLCLILCPTDAVVLWVRYPQPLWVNAIQTTASIMADVLLIRYIYGLAKRNETKTVSKRAESQDEG